MRIKRTKPGFTLVELSLSLAFVAMLALMLVLLVSNLISSYRKALTISQVNTTGQILIEEFRSSFTTGSKAETDSTKRINTITGNVTVKSDNRTINAPLAGVFCTGSYSYIWNSGYLMNSTLYTVNSTNPIRVNYGGRTYGVTARTNNKDIIRILKIRDNSREACNSFAAQKSSHPNGGFTVTVSSSESAEDLLSTDNVKYALALYDLAMSNPAFDSYNRSAFYSGSFILGTVDGGINIKASGDYCALPGDYESNFDYCAVNRFNFSIRSSG